jgi:hypothetical protein
MCPFANIIKKLQLLITAVEVSAWERTHCGCSKLLITFALGQSYEEFTVVTYGRKNYA